MPPQQQQQEEEQQQHFPLPDLSAAPQIKRAQVPHVNAGRRRVLKEGTD